MKKKVFIESDIILDVLAKRNGFFESAAMLLDLGVKNTLDLYTSAVVLANVFYILRKKYGIEKSKEQLRNLRYIIKILPINQKTVDDVLNSKFNDFEDGLQYFSAMENQIPVLITRNIKDYKEKALLILTAEEYLRNNKDTGKS